MPNQVLQIDPQNELKFKVDSSGLFEQGHTTYMRLSNPTNDTVLFKIKTTAPKKYCVRPNSGTLDPNTKVEIAITPQAVHVEPNEKHKHKFMVQSVVAPEGKTNVDLVWKEISPDQLMDYKLKCVFEAPRGTNLNDSGDNVSQNEVAKKRVAVSEESKPATKESVDGIIQSEAKRKDADSTSTGTLNAKTSSASKSENAEVEGDKDAELLILRHEESVLRQEYLQLKEEVLRLRQAADRREIRRHSFSPEKTAQRMPVPWLLTALGMALLGILIGKFFM